MQSPPPFFVIGAPRSGTTYLAELLNQHPSIFITNETRIMLHLNQALNVLPAKRRLLLRHKDEWLEHLKAALPDLIESFYRELGAPEGGRWGDKHPHYADPAKDAGCLALIDELFPESQFIHIVRDGRDVISSTIAKAWTGTDDEAIDVWIRHVDHAREFGRSIGGARYLEVKYEELIAAGDRVVDDMMRFLDLSPHEDVTRFVAEQERKRTPLSRPTRPAGEIGSSSWRDRLSPALADRIEARCRPLLEALGYEVDPAVPALAPNEDADVLPSAASPPPTVEELAVELAEERRRHAKTRDELLAERRRRIAATRRYGKLRQRLPERLDRWISSVAAGGRNRRKDDAS